MTTPEPAGDQPDAAKDTAVSTGPVSNAAASGGRRLPVLLGAATVMLAVVAALCGVKAASARSAGSTQNVALTDAAATSAVQRQVTSAVNTIFSYNYANIGATRSAAQRLLTGPAIRQYNTLFRLVQQDAPAQRLVLTTKVTSVGVELLIGNRARLLIFADQQDTRAATHQSSEAGAMFAVNAVRRDGRWKIDSIDTFSSPS
ncbi:MAG TPA: hypothetical protein VGG25_07390 [Streptosporangiaceae bacterium]